MHWDLANITLIPTHEGGREKPIKVPRGLRFTCPVFFTNVPELMEHGYDCTILFDIGKPFYPGDSVDKIPLIFTFDMDVRPWLFVGAMFRLWDGRDIGNGVIVELGTGMP